MTRPKNIRPWQELQDRLPPLSSAQKEALRRSISEDGVKYPALVLTDGRILDGANRWEITDGNCPVQVEDVPEDRALSLGIALNLARRHLTPDQLREVQERLRKDKDLQKETARELRAQGKTQEETAATIGVSRQTVDLWESSNNEKEPASNANNSNACIPDCRVKIPQSEYERIYARAQTGESQSQIAADYGVERQRISQIVNSVKKKKEEAAQRRTRAKKAEKLKLEGFHAGDFREVAKQIPDSSVDLIFTDPPYDRKTVPLYRDLGEVAARVLQPGGSLICYLGQYLVPDVLDSLLPHLRLWWTLAVVHTGSLARMREYGVVVHWKPLLWFVKGTRSDKQTFVDDAVHSAQEKDTHDWQQSLIEAKYYIQKLTPKNGLVFDPFCGGGTTARACKELGLRCITCDVDMEALALAKERYVA